MRTGLELRHLRVFAAVVEAGTYTRAARVLGISQSTVSETLGALERTLGVDLFRKAGRSVLPTPAGEVLLSYAHRMFALDGELAAELAEASNTVKATLVVAAVESIGAYVLPSRLASLRERWPTVRVEVLSASCAEIRERVAAGESDVGLVLEPEESADAGEVLARPRLLILAAPSHPMASTTAPAPSARDLRGCDFLMCDAGGSYHQILRQYFESGGVAAPRMQAMGTIEGVKRGVLASTTALGLLPEHAVASELHDGLLAEVRVAPALPCVVLRVVLAPAGHRSRVVEDLIEGLRGAHRGSPAVDPSEAGHAKLRVAGV
jgi:DNA-binding transcriptional LysR family regulator